MKSELTTEQKHKVLELAGYKFACYRGNWEYSIKMSVQEMESNMIRRALLRDECGEINQFWEMVDAAWRHYNDI